MESEGKTETGPLPGEPTESITREKRNPAKPSVEKRAKVGKSSARTRVRRRPPQPKRYASDAETGAHPLDHFRPETAPPSEKVYAIDARRREQQQRSPEVLSPIMVLQKAAMPTPEIVVHIPTPSTTELVMTELRDMWSHVPALRALRKSVTRVTRSPHWARVHDLWASRWRVRLPQQMRVRYTGPPLWLVGALAFIVPALITQPPSPAPVLTTGQHASVAAAPLREEHPELVTKLPIPVEGARLIASELTTWAPRKPSFEPTPVPASTGKLARSTTPARSTTQQPKTPKVTAARVSEGTLLVHSDPAGATVYVDQRRVGQTPLEIPKLRAGSHAVWVESEGYVRWTAGVLVRYDSVTRVEPKLQRRSDNR